MIVLKVLFWWTLISIPVGLLFGLWINRNNPPRMRQEDADWTDATYVEMVRRKSR